jgi:hypothetical protein
MGRALGGESAFAPLAAEGDEDSHPHGEQGEDATDANRPQHIQGIAFVQGIVAVTEERDFIE